MSNVMQINITIDLLSKNDYNKIMRYNGKIHIVYDGMWGSCGKGKFCGELALDPKLKIDVCVNNNAPNAGHSFVFEDGRKVVTKHIPIGFVNKNIPFLVLGESSVIDYDRLVYELEEYKDLLNGRKLYIADTAAVILTEHKDKEVSSIKTGSTFSGAGAASVDKLNRTNSLVFRDERFKELERKGLIKIVPSKTFFSCIYEGLSGFSGNENILVELSQGDALSINNSDNYPFTTSRDCTPAAALKDIHATDYSQNVRKYCVFRPYPIRINNVGKAGFAYTGDFAGADEISWEEVCERCGLDPNEVSKKEFTTNTKKLRRVAEFSVKQFGKMLMDTKPDELFLNFAQYVDGHLEGLNETEAIKAQKQFVDPFKYDLYDDEEYQEVCIKNWAIEHLLGYVEDMKNLFKEACNDRVEINITKLGTGARCGETLRVAKLKNVSSARHANKDLNPLDYADKTNVPDFDLDLN